MFNLFKKTEIAIQHVLESKVNVRETIEAIHNEFYTAGENSLKEALAILNGKENIIKKSYRLSKLGFKQSSDTIRGLDLSITKEKADLVLMYKQKYPLNKFITEDQVTYINNKYGLVCAPVDRYKGFVPESKLKQIESFSLSKEDEADEIVKVYFSYEKTQDADGIKKLRSVYPDDIIPISLLSWSLGHIKGFGGGSGIISLSKVDKLDSKKLHICAPKKDVDMDGLQLIGNKYMSYTVEIPDPIVLQPVKGGYLILAAWGLEASDESVVNEKHN